MHLLIAKTTFAISIFLLTILAGLLPLRLIKNNLRFLNLSDSFASGIFLSTALLHMLPDAVSKFNDFGYPLPYLICLVAFIGFFIMDHGVLISSAKSGSSNSSKFFVPVFLVFLLSIHALVEGAAIGANTSLIEASAIFLAIMAHKGSESFALAINLHNSAIAVKKIKQIIAAFSFMTPLGIFMASWLINHTNNNSADLVSGYFDAVAAGTFLYLGTERLLDGKKSLNNVSNTIALLLGVLLMALIATWV